MKPFVLIGDIMIDSVKATRFFKKFKPMRLNKSGNSGLTQQQLVNDNEHALKAVEKIDEYIRTTTSTVRQLFSGLDKDLNGSLEKQEIICGLMKLADISLTPGQVSLDYNF